MTIKGLFTNKIRHLKPVYLQTIAKQQWKQNIYFK